MPVSDGQVIYETPDGRQLLREHVAEASGPMPGLPPEAEAPSEEAGRLHALGRAAGSVGQYHLALTRFAEARAAAPSWPYPLYDAGFTHLYTSDPAAAVRMFEAVEAMAPYGFLNTQMVLDTVRRELAGRTEPGIAVTLTLVEADSDRGRRRLVLQAMASTNPEVPRVWQLLAEVAVDTDERLAFVARGLAADPDPTTRCMLVIHDAWIRYVRGEEAASVATLGALALDPGTPREMARRARWALSRLLAEPASNVGE